MDAAVEVDNLTKRYGDKLAVDAASFALYPGQLVGLLGPNGAGKTTTLGMLSGLVRPTSGTIRLFGQPLQARASDLLRHVGLMPEVATFYPYLSGRDNLRVMAATYGVDARQIDGLIEQVGLTENAHRPFKTYSQGMRQLLSLANALLGDPDLLLLDEPTNGLDPHGQQRVHNLLRKLAARGKAILLSSHLLRDVEEICERVIIINRGRIVADGRLDDLLRASARILLRTTDDERALTLLSAADRPGWIGNIAVEDGRLVLQAPPEQAGELSAFLARHDIYPVELMPQRESLRSLFAEVTGETTDGRPGA
uniref:ABC transporter ATP-binding protein n=1 Tax=Thermorudis sp. TaxID=1969470 RepID=A0A7C3ARD1_9BACT